MPNGNASSPVDADDLDVVLRVLLVSSLCLASTVGNAALLAIFWSSSRGESPGNNRCRVVDIIIASLTAAVFLRGLSLGPVRVACFIQGEWPLGHSLCQFQAYFEAVLRNAIPWFLGFLSIERYTKHMVPHEYLVTFTPLTVNIVLPGLLLIVIVQVTGPLYGWGKYEYIPEIGLCGAATPSTFGCSYALCLLFSITLPPLIAILVNSFLLSSMFFRKVSKSDKSSLKACGDSRVLNPKHEIPFLVVLMVLFLILSIPRLVLDASTVCAASATDTLEQDLQHPTGLSSPEVFAVYYLESFTDLLLPLLCLTMHPESRKMFRDVLRKKRVAQQCVKQISFPDL